MNFLHSINLFCSYYFVIFLFQRPDKTISCYYVGARSLERWEQDKALDPFSRGGIEPRESQHWEFGEG